MEFAVQLISHQVFKIKENGEEKQMDSNEKKKNMNDGNCGKCVNSFESIEKVSHTIQ